MLASRINVPLTSISDMKKAPMKVFSMSKDSQSAVYILNKNKEVGVVLDIEEYNKMIDFIEQAYSIIDEAAENIYQEQIIDRLKNDDGIRYSNSEVLGSDWEKSIDNFPDEWE